MFRNLRPLPIIFILLLVSILLRMAFHDRGPVIADPETQRMEQPRQRGEGLPRGIILSIVKGKEVDGVGVLDLIVLGMAGFFAFQFMVGNIGRGNIQDPDGPDPHEQAKRHAEWMWDRLANTPDKEKPSPDLLDSPPPPEALPTPPAPRPEPRILTDAEFDAKEFLEGAQMVYSRIREALSEKDLEDVRVFATERFMGSAARIADTLQPVTVLLANGHLHELAETRRTGVPMLRARVVFDALHDMRAGGQPKQVEEAWQFVRERDNPNSTWLLDDISQAKPAH